MKRVIALLGLALLFGSSIAYADRTIFGVPITRASSCSRINAIAIR
jgi:hypothetical protein